MEKDNQQFSTPPSTNNSGAPQTKKGIYWILIFLGIVLIGIFGWVIIQKNKKVETVTPAQQITQDSNAIFSQSKLVFPKILGLTPTTPGKVPADVRLLSLEGATGQVYNTIQYENKKTGYQFSYIVSNFTTEKFMTALPEQLALPANKSPWVMQNNTRTDAVGYLEFNTSTTQARVTFFQQGGHVKVVGQSLNVK